MPSERTLGLFEAVGVEIEYVIVDTERLDVYHLTDRLMEAEAGQIVGDIVYDDITWSNEMSLHVFELKTTEPAKTLDWAADAFAKHARQANKRLKPMNALLMSTGMHPWMDPWTQVKRWSHEYSPVYESFNRIFDARGHGWANLQALHINLPFADDQEFGRLHAAIRLILPILPAIAASSPICENRITGFADMRLEVYRFNSRRVPAVAGRLIPEPVFTPADYEEKVLQYIYRSLKPYDPEGILQYEWSNARGAIARFDRNTIEIRVIDSQECPAADIAVVAAVVAVVKLLVSETWSSYKEQQDWPIEPLADLIEASMRYGEATVIESARYLRMFGWRGQTPCSAGQLWRHLIAEVRKRLPADIAFCNRELDVILDQGTLATRLVKALPVEPTQQELYDLYKLMCDLLEENRIFEPAR